MAQPPVDEVAAERAREHLIAHLFDTELTRLAYARPRTPSEERHAQAALRELARRAAEAPAPVPRIPDKPGRPHPSLARPDGPRPGRRRAGALTAAGALLLSTVAALSAAAAAPEAEPAPPSSLQTLYRDATPVERDLRDRLLAAGLLVTVGPRVLAEEPGGGEQLLAYRYVRAGTAETARNEVCVLLVEAETVHPPVCVERGAFLVEGLRATLHGPGSRWGVQWGPTGAAEAQVRRAAESPSIPLDAPGPL